MGKITIIIPDDLEEDIRKLLVAKYDGKIHGKLTDFVITALEDHLKREAARSRS
jgi:hypothetical protein